MFGLAWDAEVSTSSFGNQAGAAYSLGDASAFARDFQVDFNFLVEFKSVFHGTTKVKLFGLALCRCPTCRQTWFEATGITSTLMTGP